MKKILKNRNNLISLKIILERILKPKISNLCEIQSLFANKCGIEIGGPSKMFSSKGEMPIYHLCEQVDGCNFSNNTAWEGQIKEGYTYNYHESRKGYQYICEGSDPKNIPTNKYDFVLSCNNLEHIANPLKAIENWLRLLKDNSGFVCLILPRKDSNFDHKRVVTSLEHLIEDYNKGVTEDDMTHLDEILNKHDLTLDPSAGDYEEFRIRSENNYRNRCLHHHVFDLELLSEICLFFKLSIVFKESRVCDNVVVAFNCKKPSSENQ